MDFRYGSSSSSSRGEAPKEERRPWTRNVADMEWDSGSSLYDAFEVQAVSMELRRAMKPRRKSSEISLPPWSSSSRSIMHADDKRSLSMPRIEAAEASFTVKSRRNSSTEPLPPIQDDGELEPELDIQDDHGGGHGRKQSLKQNEHVRAATNKARFLQNLLAFVRPHWIVRRSAKISAHHHNRGHDSEQKIEKGETAAKAEVVNHEYGVGCAYKQVQLRNNLASSSAVDDRGKRHSDSMNRQRQSLRDLITNEALVCGVP